MGGRSCRHSRTDHRRQDYRTPGSVHSRSTLVPSRFATARARSGTRLTGAVADRDGSRVTGRGWGAEVAEPESTPEEPRQDEESGEAPVLRSTRLPSASVPASSLRSSLDDQQARSTELRE